MEDYTILESHSNIMLRNEVKQYLKMGWYCQGGVSTSKGPSGILMYAQAMMKRIGS